MAFSFLTDEEIEKLRVAYSGEDTAELEQVLQWAELVRMRDGFLDGLLSGQMSIRMKDGEPQFTLTDDGEEAAANMIKGRR